MERKGCKRFDTTEAEIEEKRLKLNAERTIKENWQKYCLQLYCDVYHVCSVIYCATYLNWVIRAVVLGHLWLFDGYF